MPVFDLTPSTHSNYLQFISFHSISFLFIPFIPIHSISLRSTPFLSSSLLFFPAHSTSFAFTPVSPTLSYSFQSIQVSPSSLKLLLTHLTHAVSFRFLSIFPGFRSFPVPRVEVLGALFWPPQLGNPLRRTHPMPTPYKERLAPGLGIQGGTSSGGGASCSSCLVPPP